MSIERIMLTCFLALGAGCLAPPAAAESDEALTRAPLTGRDRFSVAIAAGDRNCSGSVLSAHWILTAAHCATVAADAVLEVTLAELPDAPGGPAPVRHLYHGRARYLPNPAWDPTQVGGVTVDPDADNDIGLVQLVDRGLDLNAVQIAPLFDEDEEPWHGHGNRSFSMIGSGLGTDPGGSNDCDDGSSRGRRLASGFTVDVSGDDFQAHAPYGDTHPCPGDSGSPWLFTRGTTHPFDMVFAVMSSMRPGLVLVGPKMWGALVKPWRPWIERTTAGSAWPLRCGAHTQDGWRYRRCDEPLIDVSEEAPRAP